MAATNVVKAFQDKWLSLTAANFPSSTVPPIALDNMPPTNATPAQQYPPYAIVRDGGIRPVYDAEYNVVEGSELTLEIYGLGPDVEQCAEAAKYNGGAINAGAGLDFGTLTLAAGTGKRVLMAMVRTGEQWRFSGISKAGERFYVCTLTYQLTVRRSL